MPDGAMDFTEVKEAISAVNKTFEEFKQKNTEHLTEVDKKFDDVVRREELDRMNEGMSELEEKLDKYSARMKRLASEAKQTEDVEKKALDWAKFTAKQRGDHVNEYSATDLDGYKRAFDRYLRKDDKVMVGEEAKALSVGSDPDGGYVVHPDMSGRIVGFIYETSPVRQYANVQSIGTDALEGLHDLDEAASGWVGETATRSETNTPELDKWRIPVHEQYAKPHATQKLLDDASIDMEGWLAGKVADKLSRTENSAFVNGDGVNKPRGFLTYADWATAGTFELGKIERFDSGANGAFDTAANGGSDVLIDALYALKDQYRANATWFMNRSVMGAVRKLRDSDNNYIWVPGLQANQPSSLLGYPVVGFEDMPNLATDSLSIAVGDMSAAYQIVDRQGIRVLRDPYSSKPYIQFYTTKRVGGDVVNFEALKLIEFTA